MDVEDWRTQLQPDSRQRIVVKIMDTLQRHLPFSGPEGLNELRKIAVRFEEKIYAAASSQADYLRQISLKMLSMETKSQATVPNSGNSSSASDPVDESNRRNMFQISQNLVENSMGEGLHSNIFATPTQMQGRQDNLHQHLWQQSQSPQQFLYQQHLLEQKLQQMTLQGSDGKDLQEQAYQQMPTLNGEPAVYIDDWRIQLQPDARQRIVNKIMDILKRHIPYSGPEGLDEIRKIAIRFEEKNYAAAYSQSDYLKRISLKMLPWETGSHATVQNPGNSSSTSTSDPP